MKSIEFEKPLLAVAMNKKDILHDSSEDEILALFSEKEQAIYPVEIKYVSKRVIGKSLYSFIEKFNPPVAFILTKNYLGEEKICGTKIKFIPIAYF